MAKVYIVNKGSHDYSDAEQYGEIIILSEAGKISRHSPSTIFIEFMKELKNSSIDDYLLLSGLSLVNAIAAAIMSRLHGKVNFLIYHQSRRTYIKRDISFTSLDKEKL